MLSNKEINLKHSTAYIINWYRSQLTVRSRKFFSVPILLLSCYRNHKAAYPKEYRFSSTWVVCVCVCAHVKGAQETRPTSNSICSLRTDLNSWPFHLCFLGSAITDMSYHSSLKPRWRANPGCHACSKQALYLLNESPAQGVLGN